MGLEDALIPVYLTGKHEKELLKQFRDLLKGKRLYRIKTIRKENNRYVND
jgi:hypothetical protein